MRHLIAGTLLAMALVFTLAPQVEGHEQKFMGTVTSIEGEHLEITTTEGKPVMIMLDGKTKILRGKETQKASDIKSGDRIVATTVDGKHKDGKTMLMAKEIRLGTAPAASQGGDHSAAGHQSARATGEAAVIEKWLAEYDAAFNVKDLEKLGSFYLPDATIYEGGGIDNGWAAYRDGHLGPELKAFENLQFAHTNRQIHVLDDGRSAYAVSQYTLKAKMGERNIDSGGLETLVLVKGADGAWKIRHSHTSSRPRRPPQK